MTDPKYIKPGLDCAKTVMLEEMFELGKEICKADRFGWDNRWPVVAGESNRERAIKECDDVIGAATRLRTELIHSTPGGLHHQDFGLGIRAVKPDMGRIQNWRRVDACGGLGYVIVGRFLDHTRLIGCANAHTTYVVKHDEKTGAVETRNSRYTLVGPESFAGRDVA